jgi:hypothetical protein
VEQDRPTIDELWSLVQEQRSKIEALEAKRARRGFFRHMVPGRMALVAVTAFAAVSMVTSSFASVPDSNGLVTICYPNTTTKSPAYVSANGVCGSGWDKVQVVANGAPISASQITGVVGTSNGGTGLSSSGPAGNYLRSNGTTWTSSPIQESDLPNLSDKYVDLSTDQTIGGTKTFTNTIHGSITGNASYATNAGYASSAGHATSADSATNATNFTGSLSGDVTGTQSNTHVVGIQGTGVSSATPSSGDVLTFNGTRWAPSAPGTPGYTTVMTTPSLAARAASEVEASCPSDYPHIISGGYYNYHPYDPSAGTGVRIDGESPNLNNNAWLVNYTNFDSSPDTIYLYALCSSQ